MVTARQVDPSGTAMIRRRFVAELNRRFDRLRIKIWHLIDTEDALGLRRNPLLDSNDIFNADSPGNCGTGAGGFQPGNTCAKGGQGFVDSSPGQGGTGQEIHDRHKKKKGMEKGKAIRDDIAQEAVNRGYDINRSDSKSTNSVYLYITKGRGEELQTVIQVRLSDHSTAFKRTGQVGNHHNMLTKSVRADQIQRALDALPSLGGKGQEFVVNELTLNTRWKFNSTDEQAELFKAWLVEQIQLEILPVIQDSLRSKDAWWVQYIVKGFEEGAGKTFDEIRGKGLFTSPSVSSFFSGTRSEFLRQSFARPISLERVKRLTGRAMNELKGVTDDMANKLTRELLDGLVRGENPRVIARTLVKKVDGFSSREGKQRAQTIARTEIIRAHAEGQLDAMENLGVTHVGVAVEWSTAKDYRVCPECRALEGIVLAIDKAHGLIPIHPNCRCAFRPANVGEGTKGQVRDKGAIETAVREAIETRLPKKKRSGTDIDRALKQSPWGEKRFENAPKSLFE